MPKSPAYLWYPKDVFDSERVDNLSAAEECWYRRALDRAWGDEGIVADPVKAAKRIGKKCTVKAAEMILKTFFVPKRKDPAKMVNPRQEKERKKYEENYLKKSRAGKESGRKRREQKGLDTEQCSNGVHGVFEQSKSIPIPSSKEDFKRLIETCARENSGKDERLVEIGVLYTLLQRNGTKTPINSLAYFLPEIEKACSAPLSPASVEALLQTRRAQYWKKRGW